VHRAILSAQQPTARPDTLPSEPGGYKNFEALFGAKYINTAFGAPLADLDGNTLKGSDGMGGTEPGFPGFSPTATQTLGAVATMLEKGVPVAFAYIADVHDNRSASGTFGPGQAGYETQLQQYNKAFGRSSRGWRKTESIRRTLSSFSLPTKATISSARRPARPIAME
jgi:hypothetical protein